MQRLDFKLDEFVRISWVSEKARARWLPVFNDLSEKFIKIERATVTRGVRRVALQQTDDLINLTKEMMQERMSVLPLEKVNKAAFYQSAGKAFDPNIPYEYKVAIGSAADVSKFAVSSSCAKTLGGLLGYPECCVAFFRKYWVREGWFDTTLPMLGETSKQTESFHNSDPRNNILLRYLGLRPVSHLPCSFTCAATRRVADDYKAVANSIGYERDWQQLMEILSWPVEWNSLHGIAQIITPVCKVTTASDALPLKRTVRLVNNFIPEDAGSGVDFPFIEDTWTANGFDTLQGMRKAHDRIIDALQLYNPHSVLDLGCGTGELLRRIHKDFGADTWGVDEDWKKKPDLVCNIYDLDMNALFQDYDFALVAAQRLLENPERWEKLERRLREKVKNLMIYDHNTGAIDVRTYDKTPVSDSI